MKREYLLNKLHSISFLSRKKEGVNDGFPITIRFR